MAAHFLEVAVVGRPRSVPRWWNYCKGSVVMTTTLLTAEHTVARCGHAGVSLAGMAALQAAHVRLLYEAEREGWFGLVEEERGRTE